MDKPAKLTKIQEWKKQTYNAWYLPYSGDYGIKGDNGGYNTPTLFKCDKCLEVYTYEGVTKKPVLYYYREMPKRQKIKPCVACLGKKVIIKHM